MKAEFAVGSNQPVLIGDDDQVRQGDAGLTITEWGGGIVLQRSPLYGATFQDVIAHGNATGNIGLIGRQVLASQTAALARFAKLYGYMTDGADGTLTLSFGSGASAKTYIMAGAIIERLARTPESGGCLLVFTINFAITSIEDPTANPNTL